MAKWTVLFCLAGIAAAQTQPTFRVGTRLVQVDAVVLNDKTPVRGLTKDDFTVQDKGKTQSIAVFAVTEAHKAPKSDPIPPNVASNRMSNSGQQTSTATVILFDKLNTPASAQVYARRQALALLGSLKDTDRVAFYALGQELKTVQDFTDGGERLARVAQRLNAPSGGQTAADDQALAAALQDALTAMQPINDNSTKVAITWNAFRTIVRHVEGIPGRKNLVWLTASFPLTYGSGTDRRGNDEAEVNRVLKLMSEANVAMYPVDPRGAGAGNLLVPANDAPQEASRLAGAVSRVQSSASTLGGTQTMQQLAEETGGKAYYNTNDLAGALREVMDTTEVTYTLGFYVDEKALDGKNHDLSVKLVKKPETQKATVRHRKSYAALTGQALAAQQPRPAAAELAAEPLDATALGIMAATAPHPNQPGIHLVQVRVDLGDLTLERQGDKWAGAFDLGLVMQSAGRQGDVSVKTIKLSLSDEQLKQALASGLVVDNTVPSPPQAMKLRVVVQDKTSGAAGSVRIPIAPK